MPITVVLGEQRGDEGKGRYVDMLAENHEIVARFNGGHNAGHTVVIPKETDRQGDVLKLHLMPSGIAHEHTTNIIGNGTYICPVNLLEEIKNAKSKGLNAEPDRLKVSSAAHLILPHYISYNQIEEADKSNDQGSTCRGIAATGSAKFSRSGIQAREIAKADLSDILYYAGKELEALQDKRKEAGLDPVNVKEAIDGFRESALAVGKYVVDTVVYLNDRMREKPDMKVLAEGAQAFWLDIDHGMYPYVTSSTASVGGVLTGLGVGPKHIDRIIGVSKVTQSHVGGGPFVTEIHDPVLLDKLHGDMGAVDAERGTSTGRVRRLGHLDLPMMKRANMVNGTQEIALTKLDWIQRYGEEFPVCVGYIKGREFTTIAPSSSEELGQHEPVYISLKTWKEDVSNIRDYDKLPPEAKRFINVIEEYTELPVTMIGVGPGREQVIVREPHEPAKFGSAV